jgi:hypothetical protein
MRPLQQHLLLPGSAFSGLTLSRPAALQAPAEAPQAVEAQQVELLGQHAQPATKVALSQPRAQARSS